MTKVKIEARPAAGNGAKAIHEQVEQDVERRGQPTMADVAKLAGVSAMTVSRVMNGKGLVRESTRRKVADAVAALNYTPNQEARNLAGSKPIRVGFLYSNPSAGYLSEFLVGLLSQSGLNNVQLFVEKCEAGQHEEAQTRHLIENGLDGIILPPPPATAKPSSPAWPRPGFRPWRSPAACRTNVSARSAWTTTTPPTT
jgi:LacI family transcriptional regulator